MKYPQDTLPPYSAFPRLFGTYETEIWPFIEECQKFKFDAIVDIGSGEGYFAVGLSILHPESKIFAFDTNPKIKEFHLSLARENGVEER